MKLTKSFIIGFFMLFYLIVLTQSGFAYSENEDIYLISGESCESAFFEEDFDRKIIKNNKIKSSDGKIIWSMDQKNNENKITDEGYFQMGGSRELQKLYLENEILESDSYGMELIVNVQRMGNVGHSERPIAMMIPRIDSSDSSNYYALTYHLENMSMGKIIANLYRCKWSIINTKAPSNMNSVAEGFFIMSENIDYRARIAIRNDENRDVRLDFYINGPDHKSNTSDPLITYVDKSKNKIIEGSGKMALGTSGYRDDGWGHAPIVRYDDIKLYDIESFDNRSKDFKKYDENSKLISSEIIQDNDIDYLIDQGILKVPSDKDMKLEDTVTIAELITSLSYLDGYKVQEGEVFELDKFCENKIEDHLIDEKWGTKLDRKANRYDVAELLVNKRQCELIKLGYLKIIKEKIPNELKMAVELSIRNGYLNIEDGKFDGNELITRKDMIEILNKVLDTNKRTSSLNLKLPDIIDSGAVFQANKKIPIWGSGISGDMINIQFHNKKYKTKVKDGKWFIDLDDENYGGPYNLVIRDSFETITLEDIYVGEVFVIAGQSNAEMTVGETINGKELINKYNGYKNLKIFKAEHMMGIKSLDTSNGEWSSSVGWMVEESSAIGLYFIDELMELKEDLKDVTIGIIHMTYGGSSIELFMPDEAMDGDGFIQEDSAPIRSGFWNGFMDGMTPYGIRGVIYYQGENSTQLGYEYERLLKKYIEGLRSEFRDENLPIALVQIAGYGKNYYITDVDSWPVIRECQMRVSNTMDNVDLVTAIDLVDIDPLEIHPKKKKPIGKRLAYLAMGSIYNSKPTHRSPTVSEIRSDGNKYIATSNVDEFKLVPKNEGFKGFEILDENGFWKQSEAVLSDNKYEIVIWNDDIKEPKGVRYAWRNYPTISVFDEAEFPLLPFNSTKKLNEFSVYNVGTDEFNLRLSNHFMNNFDGIVNVTRNNTFRMIMVPNANILKYGYAIPDQQKGDEIIKLKRFEDARARNKTTETVLKIMGHNLKKGDWIRNNTRGWVIREVIEVLDKNTILVKSIENQSAGDLIERYEFFGRTKAEL